MNTPDLRLDYVTGIVLAGGRSARFGSDKLVVNFEGRPLLHRALGAVAVVAPRIVVVAAPGTEPAIPVDLEACVRVVHDPEAFGGPLVGLVAALDVVETPVALVVGGDMPRLVPAVLRQLAAAVAVGARDAAAPNVCAAAAPHAAAATLEVPGRIQPLPMALDVEAARAAATVVRSRGGRSLREILRELTVTAIPGPVWLALDPAGATITDVDRPSDIDRPSDLER